MVNARSILALPAIALMGCVRGEVAAHGTAETSSPWQLGVGARVAAEITEAEAGRLYGVAGVQRQWFDGGHDNISPSMSRDDVHCRRTPPREPGSAEN